MIRSQFHKKKILYILPCKAWEVSSSKYKDKDITDIKKFRQIF